MVPWLAEVFSKMCRWIFTGSIFLILASHVFKAEMGIFHLKQLDIVVNGCFNPDALGLIGAIG